MLRTFFLLVFISFQIQAQIIRLDIQDFEEDTAKVTSLSSLDFFAIGNANTIFSLATNHQTKFKTKHLSHLLLADFRFILNNEDALDNRGYVHYRTQKHIYKKTYYAEGFAQTRFNEVLKLGRRDLIGTGFRIHFESKDRLSINYGTGFMLDFETEIDYQTFRFHERWNNYLQVQYRNKKFKFNSNSYFQPDINNFQDFRLSSSIGLQFDFGEHFKFNSGFDINWDTKPIQDVIPITFMVRNGLTYQFTK
jgi:hypothetical protein